MRLESGASGTSPEKRRKRPGSHHLSMAIAGRARQFTPPVSVGISTSSHLATQNMTSKEILVTVAEPWDFESEAGPNLLRVWLIGQPLELGGTSARVVRVEREMRVGDRRGHYLVMRARHREEPLDGLVAGRKVPVNLGLIPGEGEWKERLGEATLVIVGTAKLGEGNSAASDGGDDTEPVRLV